MAIRLAQRVSACSLLLVFLLTSLAIQPLSVHAGDAVPNSWSPIPPLPEVRDLSHLLAGRDGNVYALGGTVQYSSTTSSVDAYTPATASWIARSPLPSTRALFAATVGHNGWLYVFGGLSCVYVNCFHTTEVDAYDPAANRWSVIGTLPAYGAQLSAATGPDGRIYLLGRFGVPSAANNPPVSLDIFDPTARSWTTVSSPIQFRGDIVPLFAPDGQLYVLDGGDLATPQLTVVAFDPVATTWRFVSTGPGGRYGFAASFGSDGRLYVLGGLTLPLGNTTAHFATDVAAYTTATGVWSSAGTVPRGLSGASAALGTDGRIYVVGNVQLASFGPPAMYAYTPACQYVLGFQTLFSRIPNTVGSCLDNEAYNPATGDALQHTTGGLLVWRKADNWTAFTDGYHTWVNGPNGLQERLNSQRFPWENNPDHLPLAS